ncbi:DUF5791 family protein [Halosolutus gelatinilyticus]|uniref:DUF5791 family protein n=1 Tax=Halosolutus gelatinilyticus TaxID=2931975 RepID=UPI001FF40DBB|nr:DUF5791 family protein [Halosolutus gelatinilyticus]
MFYDQRTTVPDSPADLRAEYDDDLRSIVDERGIDPVADETGVDRDRLESLTDGASPALTIEEAAEIQALGEDEPDPDAIVTMACEHLLLGMSTAVLDVDTLESRVDLDAEAKEIQQKIERRAPMTFDEFVHIQYVIADGAP